MSIVGGPGVVFSAKGPRGGKRPGGGKAPGGGKRLGGGKGPRGGKAPGGGKAPRGGKMPGGGKAPGGAKGPRGGKGLRGGKPPGGGAPQGFAPLGLFRGLDLVRQADTNGDGQVTAREARTSAQAFRGRNGNAANFMRRLASELQTNRSDELFADGRLGFRGVDSDLYRLAARAGLADVIEPEDFNPPPAPPAEQPVPEAAPAEPAPEPAPPAPEPPRYEPPPPYDYPPYEYPVYGPPYEPESLRQYRPLVLIPLLLPDSGNENRPRNFRPSLDFREFPEFA